MPRSLSGRTKTTSEKIRSRATHATMAAWYRADGSGLGTAHWCSGFFPRGYWQGRRRETVACVEEARSSGTGALWSFWFLVNVLSPSCTGGHKAATGQVCILSWHGQPSETTAWCRFRMGILMPGSKNTTLVIVELHPYPCHYCLVGVACVQQPTRHPECLQLLLIEGLHQPSACMPSTQVPLTVGRPSST